ncbi:unnamed protein product [Didymodactylos carnosus]|uniref:HEAT repeat domain-containing protein n=1 Tax=Didymodactylos carnosus TaxID=1234261 RepID=A0A814IN65_9BILA|nr:unnamed protein product [Didymodactylos carnosus]CAF1024965.1 unnamed protein product [Didymodactylos carnosus]CAF3691672.1 unnamed protein product [Didymodactylos carnosus]CAF3796195.1 unnamed protein product [Didymodactylos carnosus]
MAEITAKSDVIKTWLTALGDKDDVIRRYAAQALGRMGESAANSEAIEALLTALGDINSGEAPKHKSKTNERFERRLLNLLLHPHDDILMQLNNIAHNICL